MMISAIHLLHHYSQGIQIDYFCDSVQLIKSDCFSSTTIPTVADQRLLSIQTFIATISVHLKMFN